MVLSTVHVRPTEMNFYKAPLRTMEITCIMNNDIMDGCYV